MLLYVLEVVLLHLDRVLRVTGCNGCGNSRMPSSSPENSLAAYTGLPVFVFSLRSSMDYFTSIRSRHCIVFEGRPDSVTCMCVFVCDAPSRVRSVYWPVAIVRISSCPTSDNIHQMLFFVLIQSDLISPVHTHITSIPVPSVQQLYEIISRSVVQPSLVIMWLRYLRFLSLIDGVFLLDKEHTSLMPWCYGLLICHRKLDFPFSGLALISTLRLYAPPLSSPRDARGRPASSARCFGEVLTVLQTCCSHSLFWKMQRPCTQLRRLELNIRLVPRRLRHGGASADALAGIQEAEIQNAWTLAKSRVCGTVQNRVGNCVNCTPCHALTTCPRALRKTMTWQPIAQTLGTWIHSFTARSFLQSTQANEQCLFLFPL